MHPARRSALAFYPSLYSLISISTMEEITQQAMLYKRFNHFHYIELKTPWLYLKKIGVKWPGIKNNTILQNVTMNMDDAGLTVDASLSYCGNRLTWLLYRQQRK
jgi:hypothetical protein